MYGHWEGYGTGVLVFIARRGSGTLIVERVLAFLKDRK
jgi:hypothetical protein